MVARVAGLHSRLVLHWLYIDAFARWTIGGTRGRLMGDGVNAICVGAVHISDAMGGRRGRRIRFDGVANDNGCVSGWLDASYRGYHFVMPSKERALLTSLIFDGLPVCFDRALAVRLSRYSFNSPMNTGSSDNL